MKIIYVWLALTSLCLAADMPWSRAAMQIHGGTATLSAMTNSAATLDLWVDCNYADAPCLAAPPLDQNGNRFTLISRHELGTGQREHYRLEVKGVPIETVMIPTERLGKLISYSMLLDCQSTP